jgi:hypothetical protein
MCDQRERMAVLMDNARELIKTGLDYPPLLDRIDDHEDLVALGVNSGEMIRIALACEGYLGRRLTDAELAGMTSVWSITAVLTGLQER